MANTTLLRYKVEPVIRTHLEERFGKVFTPGLSTALAVPAGSSMPSATIPQSSSALRVESGRLPAAACLAARSIDASLTSTTQASSTHPFAGSVLTAPDDFYEAFINRMSGVLPEGVEVTLVPLRQACRVKLITSSEKPVRRLTVARSRIRSQQRSRRRPKLRCRAAWAELRGCVRPRRRPSRGIIDGDTPEGARNW